MEVFSDDIGWISKSWDAIEQENYSLTVQIYEKEVESRPGEVLNLFYLGLAYLLDGEEELAQMTWFSAITESEFVEISSYSQLSYILDKEAYRQSNNQNYEKSWIIRQHLREVDPSNSINHLELILLSIKLNLFSSCLLDEWQTLKVLHSRSQKLEIDTTFYKSIIDGILDYNFSEVIEITSIISQNLKEKEECFDILRAKLKSIKLQDPEFAGKISKIFLDILPNNLIVLQTIYNFYSATNNYNEAIKMAQLFYDRSTTTQWKLISIYSLIREKTRGADWIGIEPIVLEYKTLMYKLDQNGLNEEGLTVPMVLMPTLLQYIQDDINENRYLQKRFSRLFQENIVKKSFLESSANENIILEDNSSYLSNKNSAKQKLKIGFLVSRLMLHSIGWLSRWLFHYYDRDKFDFFLYIISQPPGDLFTQSWFESKVAKCSYHDGSKWQEVADSIHSDGINILVDLDSTTSCDACVILSLKPASIQASWLGYDATSLPTIDYFIVDPYLLPEDAQEHYSEKIWRLPHTYLAVDGFEIEVPTLTRRDLNIADNAIVYLSAQTGQKRHPNTIRLQLKILKAVENSYFLVKGFGDSKAIQDLFYKLAEEEGVDANRLRFLKIDKNEFVHRANLQIADVILDTYPYSGATTTLEALWMGIPIVTRLGQQCAARNSYTFLAQVEITDGIATTEEEYVEWGIRFGKEPQLRQKISNQLKQSRHTSPLWNTKKFVKDMEVSFQKMWDIYSEK